MQLNCIRFPILIMRLQVWILMGLGEHKKCLVILKKNIRWMEERNDQSYYPRIASACINIALCYFKLRKYDSAVDNASLAYHNYCFDSDIRIRKKAIKIRAASFLKLSNISNDLVSKETLFKLALQDFCLVAEMGTSRIVTGYRK